MKCTHPVLLVIIAVTAALLMSGCSLNKGKPQTIPAQDIEFEAAEGEIGSFMKTESYGKSGEKYVFESVELLLSKNSRALEDAAMKGSGQIAYSEGSDVFILTGGKVTSIAAEKVVIEIGSSLRKEIELNRRTRFCDGKTAIKRNAIAPGDMVVVVSPLGDKMIASSLRKGFMLVRTGRPGSPSRPVNFACR
jgi:hypothetical protein